MSNMKDSGVAWIGQIPESSNVYRIKNISTFINGYAFDSDDLQTEGENFVVRIGDIKDNKISFETCRKNNIEIPSLFQVKDNDILIAMSGATIGKLALAKVGDKKVYINQRVGIIRSKYYKEIFYALQTSKFLEYVNFINLSSAQPNISGGQVGEYPIVELFSDFTDYLDGKCSQVDTLIANQEHQIEKFKAYKQSLITETVTKGLNPNASMKDSGIEWIGQINADFSVHPISSLFTIKKDIIGKEPDCVLSITQSGIKIKDTQSNEGQNAASYDNYQIVNVGDFAMNHMDLLTGWIDISKYNGVTSPDYRVFVIKDTKMISKYFLYVFQSYYTNKVFYGFGQGVSNFGRWRLPAFNFNRISIPVPPVEEQQKIANHLDEQCAKIDALIEIKQQKIAKLTDYKKSLIYEYVTGKKEV